jgi:hypothetical protein
MARRMSWAYQPLATDVPAAGSVLVSQERSAFRRIFGRLFSRVNFWLVLALILLKG